MKKETVMMTKFQMKKMINEFNIKVNTEENYDTLMRKDYDFISTGELYRVEFFDDGCVEIFVYDVEDKCLGKIFFDSCDRTFGLFLINKIK